MSTETTSAVETLLTVKGFIHMLLAGLEDGSWTEDQKMLFSADPEGNRYIGFTNEIGYAPTKVVDGRFAPETVIVSNAEEFNATIIFPTYEIDPEV